MTCEICDTQPATMWVEEPIDVSREGLMLSLGKKLLSCDDCGPQLGYKILAPLEPAFTSVSIPLSDTTTRADQALSRVCPCGDAR